jgi:diguanylate cyclase (GGDEF)-like protein
MFLSSLLLLGLASLFTYISHSSLTRQFSDHRKTQVERQAKEIQLALSRSEESLRQFASLLAASYRLGPALISNDSTTVIHSLSSQWPTLQLESGIDEILVLNALGDRIASWGIPQEGVFRPVRDWAQQVMYSEAPMSTLRCTYDCRQYTAVPVLVEGASVGMVVVSRSLADVTRQAQRMADSEVALLVAGQAASADMVGERTLDAWNGHLETVTHQSVTLPLLRDAARQATLSQLVNAPLIIQSGNSYYEVSAIRLDSNNSSQSAGYFLLVSDITGQIHTITQDTRTSLIISLLGWLAAELLLLVILWRPMARLRRLADVLPSLANGGYSKARVMVPFPQKRLLDEIDVLDTTTLDLAVQLESFEYELRSRSEQLTLRVRELAHERDFVESLLNTARVFILTQDAQGHIMMVNGYALSMLSLDEASLIGKSFDDIFLYRELKGKASIGTHQDERVVQLPGQPERTIVWAHAALPAQQGEASTRISVGLDITERKAAEARLTWLAQHDPLTELYNRRFFQEALDRALGQNCPGAVLFLDLDQFKEVNELSGHHAGDSLLRMVAEALHKEFGRDYVIARLGGDEFSILLHDVDAKQAIQAAKSIDRVLDNVGLTVSSRLHRAVASIGIALYPMHGDTPSDIMASADVAMYKAKESGVQRWYLLEAIQHAKDELQQRVYWVERVRKALREDDFVLMVQPIVRLADRDVRHYEVLLRMRNEDGSLVAPGSFIPIAERSGQIIQLDRWVLRESLKALRSVQHQGISLAVNLSGQSFHDDGLTRFLANELTISGADPHKLILEITETAAVTDFATARGMMQGIRDLGCRTALDDFGVGFSSFHYLSQLPVDYIKIDGSFIRNLATSVDSRIIVKAIADIAQGFGKQAIAEFVDQEALIPLLQDYGITYGQGFHLGKPTPMKATFSTMVEIKKINHL